MGYSGERWRLVESLTGQTQIKVDEKGRMILPIHAHELLIDQSLVLSLSVYEKRVYLEFLSITDWEQKIESINELPKNHPRTKALKRFVLSGSVKVNVDKQNRITVPLYQRTALGLQREAIVINLENKFELWSLMTWQETFGSLVEDMEELEAWAFGDNDSKGSLSAVGGESDKLKSAA